MAYTGFHRRVSERPSPQTRSHRAGAGGGGALEFALNRICMCKIIYRRATAGQRLHGGRGRFWAWWTRSPGSPFLFFLLLNSRSADAESVTYNIVGIHHEQGNGASLPPAGTALIIDSLLWAVRGGGPSSMLDSQLFVLSRGWRGAPANFLIASEFSQSKPFGSGTYPGSDFDQTGYQDHSNALGKRRESCVRI